VQRFRRQLEVCVLELEMRVGLEVPSDGALDLGLVIVGCDAHDENDNVAARMSFDMSVA
jgi:hypothetical protein